jgi:hypothetical protein
MKAARVFYDKQVLPDGSIIEMVIWKLPAPEPGRPHGLKYRLFFGRDGERIVGYDNERGKGDHRHRNGREEPYKFKTVEALVTDFLRDVKRARGKS